MNLLFDVLLPRRVPKLRPADVCRRILPTPAALSSSTPCLLRSGRFYSPGLASRPAPSRNTLVRRSVVLSIVSLRRFASGRGIITNYEDLPPDYRDAEGLPFRDIDLTNTEVQRLFGINSGIRMRDANTLLRILHGRRVAGTLDDPVFFRHTSRYTAAQKATALEFLRKTVPVDEVFNAGLRAQDELEQLGEELEDADTQPNGVAEVSDKGAVQPASESDPVYGQSVISEIRARNIAKREAEEKRQKELEEQQDREREAAHPGTLMALEQNRQLSPRMQKWIENAGSKLKEPPKMTHWERLGPSLVLVATFVGLCVLLASYYRPPRQRDRLFPDLPPAAATVLALIALNTMVWAAWRLPPLWGFMNKYFVLVHGLPRPVTLVTATFSHADFLHLAGNMVGLWFLGTRLHDDAGVGRGMFLAIYLSSGALGFLGSLAWLTTRGILTASGVGASASVYGVFGAYFWLHRFDTFKVLGLPPDPLEGVNGLGFIGLIVALHLSAMMSRGKQTIDLVAHLVGMATGMVWATWLEGRRAPESGHGKVGGDQKRWTVDLWTRASQPKTAPPPPPKNNPERAEVQESNE